MFPSIRSTYIYNSRYKSTNCTYSYYLARKHLLRANTFRLVGDILYSKNILRTLQASRWPIVSAVKQKIKRNTNEYCVEINETNHTIRDRCSPICILRRS